MMEWSFEVEWSQILCSLVGFTKTKTELFLLQHITTLTSIQAQIIFFQEISCFSLKGLDSTVVIGVPVFIEFMPPCWCNIFLKSKGYHNERIIVSLQGRVYKEAP